MKLFKRDLNDGLMELKDHEVILGYESPIVVQHAIIEFSYDCRYLAILEKETNSIKICEIHEKTDKSNV